MSRQNPTLLPSAANLMAAAGAIRSAVSTGSMDGLKAALTAAADGFEQASAAIAALERRSRDLGEANVDLSGRSAPMVVSGDRIRGGIPVQGVLPNLVGQSMDLTFTDRVAHVTSMDHGTGGYLELDLDGLGVTVNAHGGTITLTGTISLSAPLPIAQGGTANVTASAAFNALSPMSAVGDTIYGGTAGAGTRLAGNTTTTRKFLRQTGGGAASAAPAWDTVDAADVTAGTLALARGGTGSSTGSITGSGALTFASAGATTVALKPGTDSTTAIQLQNAAGTAVVNADTTNTVVGVGTTALAIAPTAGRAYVAVQGPAGAGVLELSNVNTESPGTLVGQISWSDPNITAAAKRNAIINVLTAGSTPNDLGGTMVFFTKADGGAITERMRLNHAGQLLLGTATGGASILRAVGLPTSAAGLSAGDVWVDTGAANVLKIV